MQPYIVDLHRSDTSSTEKLHSGTDYESPEGE